MTVDIYTKVTCFYCMRAKALLEEKQVSFNEIKIDNNAELRNAMIKRSGGVTVPQIFIGDHYVGGCDELFALHAANKLDELLAKD
ncbi:MULTISPECIES: glutaredoxin 3 [unclassified Colwellia]|jgi:glutaredoxin 3|uniref:glutaredoxin 3 n=1 Tax=unclassified Colwellia TaxID=196834 RepID=UPI0015F4A37C|nr:MULTISPECIES: glutaredoxin 3 [unclassified Colwellia]MBA6336445.1 glutaredoxin 3 [Colwellia sp. BRX8-7]MBA6352852.1 glutaredoxin 3 [Colwellia sp. BRX9-1]MBA6356296.1 glutaredoxin 3 [Colwellia sp. BRX8-3]MBA6360122.1 glutaredoxin 3 [Colwellia sp. BRX8-6]MBA6369231.1 glutaredoxin 3 [Colwellia sp. BRX8-5]|tara:strand:+ start:984 stop:1238 length:255 start_codon:yes stop_codon:yes gene_type:complete